MMKGHAEIAGGGFGGLTAAIALATRGWTVRVHERHESLRTEGFAISVHLNGLRVLDALGISSEVIACSTRVLEQRRYGYQGVAAGIFPLKATYRVPRQSLISIMEARARSLGIDIQYGSQVLSASPDGQCQFAKGARAQADLVVAADGYNSAIRDGLRLIKERRQLPDGAMRILGPDPIAVPNAASLPSSASSEYWSGSRRVLCGRCNGGLLYTALTCLTSDVEGRSTPLEVDSWSSAFPYLGSLFSHLGQTADWSRIRFVPFEVIRLHAWHAGKIALVGDAAHAMPPNLGQGGGIAMMNALALAKHVSEARDLEQGLTVWERAERPLTEHTQNWALAYSAVTRWPPTLRSGLFKAIQKSSWLRASFQRAANTPPAGWNPEHSLLDLGRAS